MRLPNEFELKEGTLEELNAIISQPGFKGVIKNLPEHLYHKSKGLSRSAVVQAKSTISNFLDYLESERTVTPAMEFGTDVHCAILEPEKFQSNYVAEPLKEDFEGLLITSDDLKAELEKHIDIAPLEEKVEAKKNELAEFEGKLAPAEVAKIEKVIADKIVEIEAQEWKTKKDMNAKLKEMTTPLKESLKIIKDQHKLHVKTLKEELKGYSEELSFQKKLLTATKPTMIKELRKYNKDVPIWDEIMSNFKRESEGKRIVTQNNMKKLVKIMKNSLKRIKLRALLSSGYAEITMYWTDPQTGLLFKLRLDFLTLTEHVILPLDFKTCPNADTIPFLNTVAKKDYHFQAAMYLEGVNIVLEPLTRGQLDSFVFIPVENERACEINNIELGEASLQKGRDEFRDAANKIAHYYEALEKGEEINTGYPQDIVTGEIPVYALA